MLSNFAKKAIAEKITSAIAASDKSVASLGDGGTYHLYWDGDKCIIEFKPPEP